MNDANIFISKSDREELQDIFPGIKLGLRELKFIIGYLAINCEIDRLSESAIQSEVLSNVRTRAREEQIGFINRFLKDARFDEGELAFIEDSKSHGFLVEKIIENLRNNSGILPYGNLKSGEVKHVLGYKDYLIFLIDAQIGSLESKRNLVEIVKSIYYKYAQKTDFIKWYRAEKDRVPLAFEYFRMRGLYFSTQSDFLDVHDLMIFFWDDRRTKEEVKLLDVNFRRYYHNRKSRETKATKQANFSLSDKSINNIEKIARKYGVTKSMVVDAIFRNQLIMKQIDKALENRLEFSLPDYPPPCVKNRIND